MIKQPDLQRIERISNISQSIITAAAIVVGGWWFIQSRESKPRINITNEITTKMLNDKSALVFMEMSLENVGNVLVEIDRIRVSLDQIIPVENKEILSQIDNGKPFEIYNSKWHWPTLYTYNLNASIVLEPDERDKVVMQFVIPRTISTFQIYSFVKNASSDDNVGWPNTSLHQIVEEVP